MDEDFFAWLADQYAQSCLHLGLLESERLLDRLAGCPTYPVPGAGPLGEDVQILDLADCRLGDEDAQVLAAVISGAEVASAIDLSQNEIGDAGAVALSELLVPSCHVTHLNLSRNEVGEIGGLAFCNALSRASGLPSSAKPVVTLEQNPLPPSVAAMLARHAPVEPKSDEGGDPTTFSVVELLRAEAGVEGDGGDFSSEEEEAPGWAVPKGGAGQELALRRYVRTAPPAEDPGGALVNLEEISQLPDYPIDLEEMARKDFLEQGIRELLVDSDSLDLANLSFPLEDLEGKLDTLRTCRITELDLGFNNLDSVPKPLPLGLRRLYLKGNRIGALENLHHCPMLEVLDLSQNELGGRKGGFLPGLCLLHLSDLSLSRNALCELDVVGTLGHLDCLERLDVSGNNLEPSEIIQQLALTHGAAMKDLSLEGNEGGGEYAAQAKQELDCLEKLDGATMAMAGHKGDSGGRHNKLSRLLRPWRRTAPEGQGEEGDELSPSAVGEDAGSGGGSSRDFGDFCLLAARLGVLELPHQRTAFGYFSKTSEELWEIFRDLDGGDEGALAPQAFALGLDRLQRRFGDAITSRGARTPAAIEGRSKVQEYLGNDTLRSLFSHFSTPRREGRPQTDAHMTFLDLLRWIDTCFCGKRSRRGRAKQKLMVSFFTRDRKHPEFNFLDFVFSIFFVCSMTEQGVEKVLRRAAERARSTRPDRLTTAEEVTSVSELKQRHVVESALKAEGKENADVSGKSQEARRAYRDLYLGGLPAEEFVKHRDPELLLGVVETAYKDHVRFAESDGARIRELRKALGDVTRRFQDLLP